MSVIYLIGSILMAFQLVHLYIILGLMKYPFQDRLGLISIVMLGSIFQSVLVFCGIWVFILLVETVIKIYEK